MQTATLALAAGLVILAGSASACGSSEPGRPAEPPATGAITWSELGTWSGGPGRLTESFEISPFPLRLRWQTTRETSPGAGHLTVTLHSAASGRPLRTFVDVHGLGSDTMDVADEQRWAYFVIEATNVEWRVTLEQPVASGPR